MFLSNDIFSVMFLSYLSGSLKYHYSVTEITTMPLGTFSKIFCAWVLFQSSVLCAQSTVDSSAMTVNPGELSGSASSVTLRDQLIALGSQSIPSMTWELGRRGQSKIGWAQAELYCQSKGVEWRLPTVWELFALKKQSSILLAASDDTPDWYWSSTDLDNGGNRFAWVVYFYVQSINYRWVNDNAMVRCVKSPYAITTAPAVTPAPTVGVSTIPFQTLPDTIQSTQVPALLWESGRFGTPMVTFTAAVAHCQSKGAGWRLPSVFESLILSRQRVVLGADLELSGDFWTNAADLTTCSFRSLNSFAPVSCVSSSSMTGSTVSRVRCVRLVNSEAAPDASSVLGFVKNLGIGPIIGIGAGGVLLVALVVGVCICCYQKNPTPQRQKQQVHPYAVEQGSPNVQTYPPPSPPQDDGGASNYTPTNNAGPNVVPDS